MYKICIKTYKIHLKTNFYILNTCLRIKTHFNVVLILL